MLINSGGILEKTLFTAEISMDITAELYKDWRLDEQALPVDLLKRYIPPSLCVCVCVSHRNKNRLAINNLEPSYA